MHPTAIILCLLLCSCAIDSSPRPFPTLPPQGPDQSLSGYFRGGAYVGSSENEDEEGETLDGSAFGGRLEFGGVLDPQIELGGRVSLGGQETDNTISGVPLDSSTLDFTIEPVIRGYFSTAKIRPYGEAFVGYMTSDLDLTGPGATVNGDADGLSYGFGAGVEFGLENNSAITVGVEFRRTDLDVEVLGITGDLDRTDILGSVNFVKRW